MPGLLQGAVTTKRMKITISHRNLPLLEREMPATIVVDCSATTKEIEMRYSLKVVIFQAI